MKLNQTMCRLIKGALVVCLLVFWAPSFINQKISSTATFSKVEEKVIQAIDATNYPRQSTQKIRRLLNIDTNDVINIGLYRSNDALSPNEIVLVEFDPAKGQKIEEILNARQQSQYDIYSGYAPDAAAAVEKGWIDVEENYAIFYVGDETEQVKNAFISALKGA
ncbi:MAG: DUF4358 domain-containing protein [Erysipelotrichaceae bacterium]|nr:DUF4358 domain-containing protein [Erysipelotrichaceae bacterium]